MGIWSKSFYMKKIITRLYRMFNKTEIDLTKGKLFKKLILFSLPVIITSIFQLLYTSADLIIVKAFGDGELSGAAVGSNNSLINLIINFFVGLSVGANVLIGSAKGANDKERGEKILHTAMLLSIISGFICLIIGVIGARWFLELMSTQEILLPKATTYLRIYFLGLPFLMIYNFGSAIMRALGDSSKPMFILLIAGIINIVMNLVFTAIFHMDVAGVGIATVISEFVSAFLIIYFLMNSKGFIKLDLKKLKLHKEEMLKIIQVGIPAGIQGIVFSISNVLIQSEVNILGHNSPEIIAGSSAANNVEGYVFAIGAGVNQGVVSMSSQNYGANNKENLNKTLLYGFICAIIFSLSSGLIAITLKVPLLKLFTTSEAALNAGIERLTIMGGLYFTCAIMGCYSSFLQGIHYTTATALITLFGVVGLRILYIFTLYRNIPELQTLGLLYISYPVSWTITIFIYMIATSIIKKRVFKKIDRRILKAEETNKTLLEN